MKILASIVQNVDVDPISIIEKLKEIELGGDNWIFEKNGKYYCGFVSGGGTHSWDDEEEISKEIYDYVKALELVRKYLKNKKSH